MCRLEVRASFLPPNWPACAFSSFFVYALQLSAALPCGPLCCRHCPRRPIIAFPSAASADPVIWRRARPTIFFTAGAALLYEGSSRARAAREKNRCSHKNGSEILPTVPPAGTIWGALPAKIVPEPSHRSVRSVRTVPQRNSGSSSWLQSNLCQTSSFLHWRWRGRTQRTIYQPQ